MFKGFNIQVGNDGFDEFVKKLYGNDYIYKDEDVGKYNAMIASYQTEIETSLEKYILKNYVEDGVLDTSKVEDDWFPNIKADIFLSHSHQDEKFIVDFAAWLYSSFELLAFIDSRVWGYCGKLLKVIDNEYCTKDTQRHNLFDYDKRNQSTAHVYMLLNGALVKMIDSTECFIFVGTHNSLDLDPSKIKDNEYSTYSPWLYSELLTSSLIKPNIPDRFYTETTILAEARLPKFKYSANLNHLHRLDITILQNLKRMHLSKQYALDELYKRFPEAR